jgi:alpha-2-macroglobulin
MGRRAPVVFVVAIAALGVAIHAEDQQHAQAPGLELTLSDAKAEPATGAARSVAQPRARDLDDAVTAHILSALPAIGPTRSALPAPLRGKSLPPPRAGRTVKLPFPTQEALPGPPARRDPGALRVLRYQPIGEAATTASVSITFSQPMIPLAAVGAPSAQNRPVRLTPEPTGKWRWLGLDTLVFEPTGGFAPGTRFSVEIPAGTRSTAGKSLAIALRWTFRTPDPKVVKLLPDDKDIAPDEIFAAVVDQALEPDVLLKSIELRANGALQPIRIATEDEIDASDEYEISSLKYREKKSHWLAFRPERPLPLNAVISVRARPRGASGSPVLGRVRRFRTPGPFSVKSVPDGRTGGYVFFSNRLPKELPLAGTVSVTPEVPDLQVEHASDTGLQLKGSFARHTTYRITLAPSLRDVYGQQLTGRRTLELRLGDDLPSLLAPEDMVVLDPTLDGVLPVYAVNRTAVEVELRAVQPEDYPAFLSVWRSLAAGRSVPPLPGRLVQRATIPIEAPRNEWIEVPLPLKAALTNGLGQVMVTLRPLPVDSSSCACSGRRRAPRAPRPFGHVVWVQVTRMTIDAVRDSDSIVASLSTIEDGQPVAGAQLLLHPNGASALTDGTGVARLSLGSTTTPLLIARHAGDVAFLSQYDGSRWEQHNAPLADESAPLDDNNREWIATARWMRRPQADDVAWHIFDPQSLYRPGDSVHLKGWVRRIGAGPRGDVAPIGAAVTRLTWVAKDSGANEIAQGDAVVNRFGGFDLTFTLPKNVSLGYAQVSLQAQAVGLGEATYVESLRVEEFRRPEFEVKTTAPRTAVVGEAIIASAAASYFGGGPLTNAPIRWETQQWWGGFTPPGREAFAFGESEIRGACDSRITALPPYEGRTDASGQQRLRIGIAGVHPPRFVSLYLTPSVADVNRQSHRGDGVAVSVHPAALYVGLRLKSRTLMVGKPVEIEAVVTDVEGRAIAGQEVLVRAERLDGGSFDRGRYCRVPGSQVVEARECRTRSGAEPTVCSLTLSSAGEVRIAASIQDLEGRPNETVLWRHAVVNPGEERREAVETGSDDPGQDDARPEASISVDKRVYRPGDVAEVTLASPFVPARATLTLDRGGILRVERFRLENDRSLVVRLPVEDAWAPSVQLSVAFTGVGPVRLAATEGDEYGRRRPALAEASTDLRVDSSARALNVRVAARETTAQPGQTVAIDLDVRDQKDQPAANAEVAVAVVDDSILVLAHYVLADPLASFARHRESDHTLHRLLERLTWRAPGPITAETAELYGYSHSLSDMGVDLGVEGGVEGGVAGGIVGGMAGGLDGKEALPRLRSDLRPVALFASSVVTDGRGRASVSVTLPDNLTRYRILAVATDGGRCFGKGESTLVVDQPLMVRPSLPRFLNLGDTADLPVVVQNHTEAQVDAELVLRASGLEVEGKPGRRVVIPANDRVEVRFPVRAAHLGEARVQVAARTVDAADAAEVSLPVRLPAATEAVAMHGHIDDDQLIALPVDPPQDVVPDYGGLSVTLSSTALAELEDAFLYLARYRFECAEQVASRLLAIAALKDMLAAFDARGELSAPKLVAQAERDIERLVKLQNDDGGFALWVHGRPSLPMASLHAAHALARAKGAGFDVPVASMTQASEYLRSFEKRIRKEGELNEDALDSLASYAIRIRHLLGDSDPGRARALLRRAGLANVSLESAAWLLPVLRRDAGSRAEAEALRRLIANRMVESSETAHVATSYRANDHVILRSDRRTDAIVLDALIEDGSGNGLLPKLVRGLLAHRRAGRWSTTHENCFVLLALSRYFATFEKQEPGFVARAWLGERGLVEAAFKGREAGRMQTSVPMGEVEKGELLLAREGKGRLYYRVGLEFATAAPRIEPVSRGFSVERSYEGVDRAEDVRRDAAGAWHIRAGARVRVRLKLTTPDRRYQVALVDPLPAGLESEYSEWSYPAACWADHENRRDDRVEAFASLLWGGEYPYSYITRATTPGVFTAGPPQVEEMYAPEVFGRGTSDRIVIEAPAD